MKEDPVVKRLKMDIANKRKAINRDATPELKALYQDDKRHLEARLKTYLKKRME